jgi:hypothetical protein
MAPAQLPRDKVIVLEVQVSALMPVQEAKAVGSISIANIFSVENFSKDGEVIATAEEPVLVSDSAATPAIEAAATCDEELSKRLLERVLEQALRKKTLQMMATNCFAMKTPQGSLEVFSADSVIIWSLGRRSV